MLALIWSTMACLFLIGCGNTLHPIVPVSGKVTLDGKPVAKVRVVFQPHGTNTSQSAAGSLGVTDAEGHFTLTTMTTPSQSGAAVGPHTVQFAPAPALAQVDAIEPQPVVIAPELRAIVRQTATFEVIAGTENEANFDLKSK